MTLWEEASAVKARVVNSDANILCAMGDENGIEVEKMLSLSCKSLGEFKIPTPALLFYFFLKFRSNRSVRKPVEAGGGGVVVNGRTLCSRRTVTREGIRSSTAITKGQIISQP